MSDLLEKPTAKIRYSIFLSPKNKAQLKAIAAYKEVSFSSLVREAINHAIRTDLFLQPEKKEDYE